MLLLYSNTSPYSRKVRLVVAEKGLTARVEQRVCNPFENVPVLSDANPLGKVPTLITDDGQVIYDSPVICEYLDTLSDDVPLLPRSGTDRWTIRRWEAMADGILDAAYAIVMERRRPAEQQSGHWIGHWTAEIDRAVQQADDDLKSLPPSLSLAHLAVATALGYLDFRLSGAGWRDARKALASWYAQFEQRPSMRDTRPA